MRIATWNVERLKHYNDIDLMLNAIEKCDADILVLTETDRRLTPDYPFRFQTTSPLIHSAVRYVDTENRVTIYSKYECIRQYQTYDENTAICVELATEKGALIVYGTIMGIFGNRHPEFKDSIVKQIEDIRKLSAGENICVIGDYNLSFSDNYYFTKVGRDLVNSTFSECGISLLTAEVEQCVDHIAISDAFVKGRSVSVKEWNRDKKLSDHKGMMIEMKNHYLDCISVENMRESDRLTIERYVSGRTLMYRAALGVFRTVKWHGDIAIAVGGGNNGGDGYALACILARHGFTCRIIKLSEKLTKDSSYFAAQAESLGVPSLPYTAGAFADADIIVDCLLGTGFQGSLRKPWLSAVNEMNSCKALIVSVDINSGMNGNTGEAETAVRSDITVTIGYVKRGLVTENAARYIKKLIVADIGIVLAEQEYKICPVSDYTREHDCTMIPAPAYLQLDQIDVSNAELIME